MTNNKFYRIDGIVEAPSYFTEVEFNNLFIDFCEERDFLFSGSINVYTDEQVESVKETAKNEEYPTQYEGCYFCSENFKHHDYNNCIYEDTDGTFTLELESSAWDEHNDTCIPVYVYDVKNCLKCGRTL